MAADEPKTECHNTQAETQTSDESRNFHIHKVKIIGVIHNGFDPEDQVDANDHVDDHTAGSDTRWWWHMDSAN